MRIGRQFMISAKTLQAYRETDYLVQLTAEGANALRLRVGVFHPGLADLYAEHAVRSGAFVTACNPYGERLDEADNLERQAALHQFLTRQGWSCLPGMGQHPTGGWPGEASFFVLGLGRAAAQSLGRKFEQNAVVWCGPDAVPQLLLLR